MARKMLERALRRAGRRFRIAYQSPSTVGLLAVVQSGLAVAAVKRSSCPSGSIQLDARHGLPPLSRLQVAAVIGPKARGDAAAQALHQHVVELLKRPAG